ncbi:hypothetical protein BC830DRAFT_1164015 [Chytriomyces sp. MP71]|nr:hypothetical protein BC830DRAFT_1164015 [Chytriomyces sp. MP71]
MHRDHRSGGGGKPLFSEKREKDWDCGSCFNKNWARRQSCNVCNAPKPSLDLGSRNGSGGGFKERDDVIEYKETRYHSDDELDDFGRKKKKKSRASNQGSILSSTGTEGSAKGDEGKGDEDEDDDRWDAWADVLVVTKNAMTDDKKRHRTRGIVRGNTVETSHVKEIDVKTHCYAIAQESVYILLPLRTTVTVANGSAIVGMMRSRFMPKGGVKGATMGAAIGLGAPTVVQITDE